MQRLPRLILTSFIAGFGCVLAACSGPSGDSDFVDRVKTAAAEEAYTGPALWQLSDTDTTVYLFGTVHTMRPDTRWQTELMTDALLSADAIYFEADTQSTGAQGDIGQAFTELGLIQDGTTLEDILPDDAEQEVEEAIDLLGLPMTSISNYKPWFVSLTLSSIHQEKIGFLSAQGAERILQAHAERRAIPVRYLETGVYQVELMASLPEEEQVALLAYTAEQIENDPEYLDRLTAQWAVGNVSAIAQSFDEDPVFGSGELKNLMLRTRNTNWTQKITKLMEDEPGTFFIAVGAAHLAGDISVQSMLAANGLNAQRLNPPKPQP